jgi:hypothetical protein
MVWLRQCGLPGRRDVSLLDPIRNVAAVRCVGILGDPDLGETRQGCRDGFRPFPPSVIIVFMDDDAADAENSQPRG